MNKLAIIHNLAKSGGTIISKCIGAMEDKALFSEIHPRGPELLVKAFDPQTAFSFTPVFQAVVWHKLFELERADESFLYLKDEQFVSTFQLISKACNALNKELVIRAWDQIDFYEKPFGLNGHRNTLAELFQSSFELQEIVIIRHPVPQWFSMVSRTVYQGIEFEEYLQGYLGYLQTLKSNKVFKYEDFAETPEQVLEEMCEALNLEYDPTWKDNWSSNDKITGDKNATKKGVETIRLKPFPKLDQHFCEQLENSNVYREIIELSGYQKFGF